PRARNDRALNSRLAGRAEPSFAGNIEDDAVGVLELALKVFLFGVVTEIEEEAAAGLLDLLLHGGEVVDLEAEMMRADEVLRIAQAGAAFAEVIEQRKIDHAVGQIDRGGEIERLLADALELEDILVEFGGFLQVAHHDCEMSKPCHW